MGTGSLQQRINIDPGALETFKCPECSNEVFADAQTIKILPALMSPQGQDGAMFLGTGKICTKCGWTATINDIALACKAILDAKANKRSILEVPATGKVRTEKES